MLHGKTLKVEVNGIFPWTVVQNTSSGLAIDGIDVTLLNIVAEKMGFEYIPHLDMRTILYPNGTLGASYGEVIQKCHEVFANWFQYIL